MWPNSTYITYMYVACTTIMPHVPPYILYIHIYTYTAPALICTPLIVSCSLRSINYIDNIVFYCGVKFTLASRQYDNLCTCCLTLNCTHHKIGAFFWIIFWLYVHDTCPPSILTSVKLKLRESAVKDQRYT